MAGAEKVLATIHELYPESPIFTAITEPAVASRYFPGTTIHNSFLQHFPVISRHHQKFLPLYMFVFEHFDLSEYDLVVSSSHCAAKSVITKPGTCHICYCHSPMRYAWDLQHEYSKSLGGFARLLWGLIASYVRIWDASTANRVDYFVAVSNHIARRISKFLRKTIRGYSPTGRR